MTAVYIHDSADATSYISRQSCVSSGVHVACPHAVARLKARRLLDHPGIGSSFGEHGGYVLGSQYPWNRLGRMHRSCSCQLLRYYKAAIEQHSDKSGEPKF